MFLRSKLRRLTAAASLVAALACISFADTLHLKDGSIIKGKITSFAGGKFTIVMGEGSRRREMTFSATEIESIKFDADSTTATTAAPSNPQQRRYDPVSNPPQTTQKASTADTSTTQQTGEKPRFKQWETGQKPSTDTRSQQTATQSRPVIQNQPQQATVVKTSAANPQPARVDPARPTPNTTTKPIAWDVKVLADNTSNGWTNTGWVVKKGQKVRITGDGTVDLGKGKKTTPSGDPDLPDPQKLLKNVATGALVAVIGDDNNDFIYVGAEREFTASRDGALFLGINEGYLDDNKGAYSVKVEIIPDTQ